jgi:hypothetical protein
MKPSLNVDSGSIIYCINQLQCTILYSITICLLHTVQTFTESEDTRCCVNKTFPPEDGHVNAQKHVEDNNVTNILLLNKELCIKVG